MDIETFMRPAMTQLAAKMASGHRTREQRNRAADWNQSRFASYAFSTPKHYSARSRAVVWIVYADFWMNREEYLTYG